MTGHATGPVALGRGVVVDAGAVIPEGWSGAPVVTVDAAALVDPAAVVADLHAAWAGRLPVVIVLAVDPAAFRTPASFTGEPWTFPAAFECWHDRLQFLVWANTYDARTDPAEPVWWWGRKALRLGARPVTGDGPGDIVLADGSAAWVDGGPRTPLDPRRLDGAVLVHRESVERNRLTVAPGPRPPHDDLAPDQLAAVAHPAGPARVIAPAGSGKTRVLVARLRHLVADRGWERDSMVAVAYTRRAAGELDGRAGDVGVRSRTLNSLGLHLLTTARGRPPVVLAERDVRRIVESLAPVKRRRANTDPVAPYIEALSEVRLGLTDPDVVEASRDDVPGLAEMFPRFRATLADGDAVDFDEQIYGAVEMLLGDGEARVAAQRSCRHLLVDEFQDLTPAHVLMLRLLALPGLDVFGVGDDDQVIYGHAGADPGYLIDFDRLFPGGGDHPLEVNYRCPPDVVATAATLLSYNHRRVDKSIRAGRTDDGSGPALSVVTHRSGAGASTVATTVQGWLADGVGAADIAVLCRVNALLLAPQVALVDAGVPVASALRPAVLERTGLRAALAWLRLATAPGDTIEGHDLIEVLRRPSRGLPPWFADRLRRRTRWTVDALAGIGRTLPDKEAVKFDGLVDDLVALRSAAATGAGTARLLAVIRDDVGLGGAMGLLDESRGGEGSSHLDDLDALAQVAGLHPDAATFEEWVRDRLAAPGDDDGVILSTVHRVKGMEWDRVVVYGVNAGILPHRLATDIEEERRVLHVAITRCRRQVEVLADGERPSPFLAEMSGSAPHTPAGAGPGAGRRPAPVVPARAATSGDEALTGAAGALAEVLRAWRRQRAGQDGVPAYVVFPDKTLRAIATGRPTSPAALRMIDGIGPTKLERYGDDVLALVAAAGDE